MPPAEEAAREYARAVEQGDHRALWSMLSERAQRELSSSEVATLLAENRAELAAFAHELDEQQPRAEGRAELFLNSQKTAELRLREGSFWVEAGHVLPFAPATPEEAAEALREAVRFRSYERVLSLLSPGAQEKFKSVFEALDEALADLDSAVVDVRQDRAVIELSGGRRIELVQRDERWFVEEIR